MIEEYWEVAIAERGLGHCSYGVLGVSTKELILKDIGLQLAHHIVDLHNLAKEEADYG